MPAIITSQFRLDVAKKVLRDIRANNYYLTLGRSNPWPLDANQKEQPEPPYDNHQYTLTDIYQNAHTMVDISSRSPTNGTMLMAPLVQWQASVRYRSYDPYDINFEAQSLGSYYVVTNLNLVYICLSAPFNGQASTSNPETIGSNSGAFRLSDGYVWQFLYQIHNTDFEKYMTAEFFPVPYVGAHFANDVYTDPAGDNALVADNNVIGREDEEISGSPEDIYYGQYQNEVAAKPNALYNIKVNSTTINVTQDTTTSADVHTYFEIKDLDNLNTESISIKWTDLVTTSSNTPGMFIVQDIKIPTTTSTIVDGAEKLDTYQFNRPAVFDAFGNELKDILVLKPPKGGFGADPRNELRAHYVGVYRTLQGINITDDLPDQGSFRQLSIIKDIKPYPLGTVFDDTFRVSSRLTFDVNSSVAGIKAGGIIEQIVANADGSSTYALGYIDEVDSAQKTINYHQTQELGLRKFTTSGTSISYKYHAEVDSRYPSLSAGSTGTDTTNNALTLTSITPPEVDHYSGDVIFVENRQKVARTDEQTERIKIVIEL
jgi:hypothetical protein